MGCTSLGHLNNVKADNDYFWVGSNQFTPVLEDIEYIHFGIMNLPSYQIIDWLVVRQICLDFKLELYYLSFCFEMLKFAWFFRENVAKLVLIVQQWVRIGPSKNIDPLEVAQNCQGNYDETGINT